VGLCTSVSYHIFDAYLFGGSAQGTYVAVDLALITDVLPN
jgi:hypothetical protein